MRLCTPRVDHNAFERKFVESRQKIAFMNGGFGLSKMRTSEPRDHLETMDSRNARTDLMPFVENLSKVVKKLDL